MKRNALGVPVQYDAGFEFVSNAIHNVAAGPFCPESLQCFSPESVSNFVKAFFFLCHLLRDRVSFVLDSADVETRIHWSPSVELSLHACGEAARGTVACGLLELLFSVEAPVLSKSVSSVFIKGIGL